jgi:polysaccharide deacetylase family protein (PEP-CTERM system associated)
LHVRKACPATNSTNDEIVQAKHQRFVFSVDVEDWYHGIPIDPATWGNREKRLEAGLDKILECLTESNSCGTFFVLGDAAKKHPKAIQRIASAGHEIACHGNSHQLVYEQTAEAFEEDIRTSKEIIENVTGCAVLGYRAPYFSISKESLWALEVLEQTGFKYDSSISSVCTWRYGIEGAPSSPYKIKNSTLLEIPVSTIGIMGKQLNLGGAYFRILPFSTFHRALNASNAELPVYYIHPWEYDPKHPKVRFRWKAMITHYWNLSSTLPKTRRLLQDRNSVTMKHFLETINPDEIDEFDLGL